MDDKRFDSVTRLLGIGASRRSVVARVLAAAVGGVALSTIEGEAASARTVCRARGVSCSRNAQCCSNTCLRGSNVPRRNRFRCGCAEGTTVCGSTCVALDSDVDNCGECGKPCTGGVCVGGQCQCDAANIDVYCFVDIDNVVHHTCGATNVDNNALNGYGTCLVNSDCIVGCAQYFEGGCICSIGMDIRTDFAGPGQDVFRFNWDPASDDYGDWVPGYGVCKSIKPRTGDTCPV